MIGLYIRVSTAQQTDNYSIPTQIERGIEFSKKAGDSFKIYQETGSGSSITKRVEINRLLNDIENGLIDKVWVIESSRLTRELSDAIILQKKFEKHKTELYVNNSLTDFSSPERLLQYHITSAVSEYQRTNIIQSSIRGKSKWQNTGNMVVPSLYGWEYEYDKNGNKVWTTVDKEVEVIELCYQLYLKDYAFNRIRTHLYDTGIRNRKGNEMANFTIKKILTQTLYIGKSWTTEGLPIDSKIYKPIIAEDIFHLVQAKINTISKDKSRGHKKWYKAKNEFSGILTCAYCKNTYFYGSNQSKTNFNEYYYHSMPICTDIKKRSFRFHELEKFIHDSILILFSCLDDIDSTMLEEWLYPKKVTSIEESNRLLSDNTIIKEKLRTILKAKDTVIDFGLDGTLNKVDVKTKVDKFNKDYKELSEEEISNNERLRELAFNKEKDYFKMLHDIALEHEDITVDNKRKLYSEVFKEMSIDNEVLKLHCFNDKVFTYALPVSLFKRKSRKLINK